MTITASATEELLVEQDGHIVTITLNRPERLNAISRPMLDECRQKWWRRTKTLTYAASS